MATGEHDYYWICGGEPFCRFCGCFGPCDEEALGPCPGGHYETSVILNDIRKVLSELYPFLEQLKTCNSSIERLERYINKYEERLEG